MSDTAIGKEMNVAQAIHTTPLNRYQILLLVLITLVFIMDGIANTVLPIAIPSLMSDWGLPRDDFKAVMGTGLFGVAIGAALGGILADRIGRCYALIGCVFLFGMMTIVSSLVTNTHQLAVVRALDGLGIGGAIPAGMALLSETMPANRRSLAISITMSGIPIGGFFAGGIASLILPHYSWPMLFILGGTGPVLLAVLFIFVLPESPCYMALKPHTWEKLKTLLAKFGHHCDRDIIFVDSAPTKKGLNLSTLFNREFGLGTTLIWLAFFFCFIGSYSMFSWGPVMMISQGLSPERMGLCIAILNFSGVVGSPISGMFIQKLGSRIATFIYCAGGIIGAAFCAVSFQYFPATSYPALSIAVFGFFIAGILNMTYTMGAHMYPPFIKGTGLGAGASIGRIGAVTSAFIGVAALNLGAAMGFFTMIGVCIVINLAALLLIKNPISRTA